MPINTPLSLHALSCFSLALNTLNKKYISLQIQSDYSDIQLSYDTQINSISSTFETITFKLIEQSPSYICSFKVTTSSHFDNKFYCKIKSAWTHDIL